MGVKRYLTTGEAARCCGVGINTVKRWIQKGELPCVITPGGHWRIPAEAYEQFIARLQAASPQPAANHKILLIEDDPAMCTLVEGAFALADFPHTFDIANDGYSGLIKIGAMQPDMILLDIMLPEINGLELMQRIRASQEGHDARIVVITGAGDRRLVKRAIEAAAPDALFHKPFDTSELVATAQALLTQSKATQIDAARSAS